MKPLYRDLRRVPLDDVLPLRPGVLYITMAEDQWDAALAEAYRVGWVLLEVDANERPVAAYRRAQPDAN